MRTLLELGVGLVLLAAGAILGAVVERSRARAGYLARRYRDHLLLLLDLAHAASSPTSSAENEGLEELRNRVLRDRPGIEADVLLFGHGSARSKLREVHLIALSAPADLNAAVVEELAWNLRGRFYRRLAPQRRWFK